MTTRLFGVDEWYHCFTRGIDKRKTFLEKSDCERFLSLLYLCNSNKVIHRSDLRYTRLTDIFLYERGDPLVTIGAFCLMPNHFHLLLKEIVDGGISQFMQKIGTSYAMYFNRKYERIGNIFVKPFRSKHVDEDVYFQRTLQYIHCNPAELYEPKWKEGVVKNMFALQQNLLTYSYSSLKLYKEKGHPFRKILDESVFEVETQSPISEMLEEARAYYAEMSR